MLPATVLALRTKFSRIVGIKEASGNLDQVSEIVNILDRNFAVMSGDDSLTLPMMSVGARGVISVVSNIVPSETAKMCGFFLKGRTKEAAQIHHKLLPLIKQLFIETNPIPVKYAASLLGLGAYAPRLPLTPLSVKNRQALLKAMKAAGAGSLYP